jgi:cytochrome P450
MTAHVVHELELPLLNTVGMERLDAIAAIEVARSQHWLAKTEMGYSVTRLEDVTAVLRDKRFHSGLSILTQMNGLPAGYTQTRRQSILSMEGDGHARLRPAGCDPPCAPW